jgi:hypothetical protein
MLFLSKQEGAAMRVLRRASIPLAVAAAGLFAACGVAYGLSAHVVESHAASAHDRGPGFDAARAEWRFAPYVLGSAKQGVPIEHAWSDLSLGASTSVDHDTAGYTAATRELKELLKLPDAMPTPAQSAKWTKLTDELDVFFGTPGLHG